MDSDPSHWLPDSPFRAPEWRSLRARYLHDRGGRPDAHLDDEWVQHARSLLAGDLSHAGQDVPSRRDAPDHAIRVALDLWGVGNPLNVIGWRRSY